MTGETHYDLEILAELAEGLLDAGTAHQVREHLAVCAPCGELLADLAAVREVLAATPTPAMPMGVTLRIERALAAEADSQRRGGVGLVDAPDWDDLMRDAPWETPVEAPQPVRLGVVAGDGSIVPAGPAPQRRTSTRRRKWAMPAVAAAAAAVVVGTAALSAGVLGAGGGDGPSRQKQSAQEPPAAKPSVVRDYMLMATPFNYDNRALNQPLGAYFSAGPMVNEPEAVDPKLASCVTKVAARSKLKPFVVDQSHFNGTEALVMVSWKDRAANKVRVDVVDPFYCKNLRKPSVGRWN